MINKAEIGIFGGSGLYEFFGKGKWIDNKIFLTEYNGKKIAFLPRHGRKHTIPPHKIDYKANVAAFKKLGVKVIIAPSAVGSLQPNIKRGDFVLCDDFVDRTRGRQDTFYDKDKVVHISSADCYCEELRKLANRACKKHKIRVHPTGTAVVIQGPRFSTKAESKWFAKMGWDVVNMTQYPEVVLALEAEMCYLNISLVTDYDVGLEGIKPVTIDEVIKVFKQNTENVKKVILDIIEMIPKERSCKCSEALKGAEI